MDDKLPDNSIPYSVPYVELSLNPEYLENAPSLEELNRQILLQTQGEAVLVNENLDISILMYIFELIRDTSSEMVFVTKEGLRVQIFDYNFSPVFKPEDIITSFLYIKYDPDVDLFTDSLEINIEEIWNNDKGSNLEEKIYFCLKEIIKQIRKTNKTTLIGKSPAVLFLLSQYYVLGKTNELWYQSDKSDNPIRIY